MILRILCYRLGGKKRFNLSIEDKCYEEYHNLSGIEMVFLFFTLKYKNKLFLLIFQFS